MEPMETENNSQYDENAQSLERKIRLKGLIDRGHRLDSAIQATSPIDSLNEVQSIIKASDDIINEGNVEDRAGHTTEVVMDAQLLKMNHELVSRVLQKSSDFNDTLYQNAIASIVFAEDVANWDALAKVVCRISHALNVQSSMLGSSNLERTEREIKQRQQRKSKKATAEDRPEEVTQLVRQDKGAEKVNIIRKQLVEIFKANNNHSMPYYKLIIDPDNFMNTIENAFQLSFLVRDGLISIVTGDDNKPHVVLPTKTEARQDRDPNQSISALNMPLCQEMIKFYKIKKPLLNAAALLEDEADGGDDESDDD